MNPSDPITAIAGLLPQPYALYFAWAVGLASVASFLSSAFTAAVKPPTTASAKWWLVAYQALSWPALNLNWARNAVVPGMPPVVQEAAKISAQLAAAAPHLTTVAEAPAISGAISPSPVADKLG